jgi:hypothetical protein
VLRTRRCKATGDGNVGNWVGCPDQRQQAHGREDERRRKADDEARVTAERRPAHARRSRSRGSTKP